MTCPYCQQEMKEGYFHNITHPIQWIPKNREPATTRGAVAPGAVKISTTGGMKGFFSGHRATAYYCETCKNVILSAVQ